MMLNTETNDHRILVDPGNSAIDTRDMPLPVLAETGHSPVTVGEIEWVRRHGNEVVASGWLDVPWLLKASKSVHGAYDDIEDGGQLAVAVDLIEGQITMDVGGDTVRIRRPWKLRGLMILAKNTGAWPGAHLRLAVPLTRYSAMRRWL